MPVPVERVATLDGLLELAVEWAADEGARHVLAPSLWQIVADELRVLLLDFHGDSIGDQSRLMLGIVRAHIGRSQPRMVALVIEAAGRIIAPGKVTLQDGIVILGETEDGLQAQRILEVDPPLRPGSPRIIRPSTTLNLGRHVNPLRPLYPLRRTP